MNRRLEPCPFCGEKDIFDNFLEPMIHDRWCIVCPTCEAGGPVADTKEDAIDKWNREEPYDEDGEEDR